MDNDEFNEPKLNVEIGSKLEIRWLNASIDFVENLCCTKLQYKFTELWSFRVAYSWAPVPWTNPPVAAAHNSEDLLTVRGWRLFADTAA